MKLIKKFENYGEGVKAHVTIEEMCNMLLKCGYTSEEISQMSNAEIEDVYNMSMKNENYGSREEMCNMLMKCGYEKEELDQMSKSEIEEICMSTDGTMAMSNEGMDHGTQNYMFFGNLKTLKRLVDNMLEMDESEVDAVLSDGHAWAVDHIATSKDDVEEVFNFLTGHDYDEENGSCGCCEDCTDEEDCYCGCEDCKCQSQPEGDDQMKTIQNFMNFKK